MYITEQRMMAWENKRLIVLCGTVLCSSFCVEASVLRLLYLLEIKGSWIQNESILHKAITYSNLTGCPSFH